MRPLWGGTLKDVADCSQLITGSFTDNGLIEAAGGKLEVASTVTSGREGRSRSTPGRACNSIMRDPLNVAFAGSGIADLEDPTHFGGTISDSGGSMTAADVIDVAGFDTSASVSYSGTDVGRHRDHHRVALATPPCT